MMRLTILLITGLALARPVFGQINESDTSSFQLRAAVTGNYQRGNVEVLTIRSKLDLSLQAFKYLVFKSQNSSLYQSFYGNKADNDIFSRNYVYYQPQKRFYPFGIAYISANFRRKIDSRFFSGAGVTWQVINKPLNVIKLSASLIYEQTNFNGTTYNYEHYNGSDKITVWRRSFYTGGWSYLFQKHLRLYYDAYWQPSFNDPHNYRSQYDIGIDFPIYKGLFATALYTFTRENIVIENIKKEDRILTFGLGYNLKKK